MLEEEFNYFLEDMKQDKTFCSYLDVWGYEDDYSHNQIEDCRKKLEKIIIEWLKENKPNKYYIIGGFDTTYLLTKEELIKRNLDPSRYKIIK